MSEARERPKAKQRRLKARVLRVDALGVSVAGPGSWRTRARDQGSRARAEAGANKDPARLSVGALARVGCCPKMAWSIKREG